jgi:hypothetical protein
MTQCYMGTSLHNNTKFEISPTDCCGEPNVVLYQVGRQAGRLAAAAARAAADQKRRRKFFNR